VSAAGLAPVLALAERAGLHDLVAEHLTVPGPAGENLMVNIPLLIAGMVAGADSITDMDLRAGLRRTLTEPALPGQPCTRRIRDGETVAPTVPPQLPGGTAEGVLRLCVQPAGQLVCVGARPVGPDGRGHGRCRLR
jgi:hypothetical protein